MIDINDKKIIYLKSMNNNLSSYKDNNLLNHFSKLIEIYYPGCQVKILNETNEVKDNQKYSYISYNCDEVLTKLSKEIPKIGTIIIGLTSLYIYTEQFD